MKSYRKSIKNIKNLIKNGSNSAPKGKNTANKTKKAKKTAIVLKAKDAAVPSKRTAVTGKKIRVLNQQGAPIAAAPAATLPVLQKDALPGWIGEFVKLACKHSEADPVAVLVTLLLRFATFFSGQFIAVSEEKQWARTFAVIVGDSAKSRIGASEKMVNRLFEGLRRDYRHLSVPLSKVEDIIYKVRDETVEQDAIHGSRHVTDRGEPDKYLFILDKNLAYSLSCKKPELDTLSSIITQLFDEGNAAIKLLKDKWLKTTGAHVAILAHIQRAELNSLREKLQIPNSYANCFLWILAQRQPPNPMPKAMPGKEVERFAGIIKKCIDEQHKITQAVALTENAVKLWEKSYSGLIMEYSGFTGSVLDRSEVHAIRLALIYALAAGRSEIRTQDIKAAIALVNYSRQSALLLFSCNPDEKIKVKLLEALGTAPNNEMTLTEISKKVFNKNMNSAEIQVILNEMVSSGLLQREEIKTAGAPKTIIRLVAVQSS